MPGGARRVARQSGSHPTLCWREMDSNFRFPAMVSFVVVPFRGVSPVRKQDASPLQNACPGSLFDTLAAAVARSAPPITARRSNRDGRQVAALIRELQDFGGIGEEHAGRHRIDR